MNSSKFHYISFNRIVCIDCGIEFAKSIDAKSHKCISTNNESKDVKRTYNSNTAILDSILDDIKSDKNL